MSLARPAHCPAPAAGSWRGPTGVQSPTKRAWPRAVAEGSGWSFGATQLDCRPAWSPRPVPSGSRAFEFVPRPFPGSIHGRRHTRVTRKTSSFTSSSVSMATRCSCCSRCSVWRWRGGSGYRAAGSAGAPRRTSGPWNNTQSTPVRQQKSRAPSSYVGERGRGCYKNFATGRVGRDRHAGCVRGDLGRPRPRPALRRAVVVRL